ncbi:MAG: hypothetical protein EOO39_03685 [Cytophagaceae bacterium]|nr:MAG: hypothetical protein EOO39_03685 [Cytophagaceae bacterium]
MLLHQDVYHRKLPHLQPLHGTFFVTFRLHGTLPAEIRRALQEEFEEEKRRQELSDKAFAESIDVISRRYFGKYDDWLDKQKSGPTYLNRKEVAQLVADSLVFHDADRIDLIAYCIMPNHVHVVFTLIGGQKENGKANSLSSFMQSVKSFSAKRANKALGLAGNFWEKESYDRCVRDDDELIRIVRYTLTNPVKAGLCEQWRDWLWSYIKPEYDMF